MRPVPMPEPVEPQLALHVQQARAARNRALRAVLRGLWMRLCMDSPATCLSQATSEHDLAQRQRQGGEGRRIPHRWFF
jgi:hypothetical protein